jgi:iron complex transport system ATP-binding protein
MIKVDNVSFGYGKGEKLLERLNFEVFNEEFAVIIGPNGAGKTTLVKLMCGILKPIKGKVFIDSKNIKRYSLKQLAAKTAYVGQDLELIFDFSVEQLVSMGRLPFLGLAALESREDMKIIYESLELTGTGQFRTRSFRQVSAGERQRVLIAKALCQQTDVLLLDEPTAHLDMKYQVEIYDLLKRMQKEKRKTIVTVTHDLYFAQRYADKVLLLGVGGNFKSGAVGEIITAENIREFFDIDIEAGQIKGKEFYLPKIENDR